MRANLDLIDCTDPPNMVLEPAVAIEPKPAACRERATHGEADPRESVTTNMRWQVNKVLAFGAVMAVFMVARYFS